MLTVREVMHSEVVTVTPGATVRQLARLLADEEISGVPVVDGNGALMGVVSSTDVVRLAAEDSDIALTPATLLREPPAPADPDGDEEVDSDPFGFFLPEDSPFADGALLEHLSETELDTVTVADIMTPVPFSVGPDDTLMEVADFLVRGRIHRALVVGDGRLLGIVTSGDVLRAVAEGRLD